MNIFKIDKIFIKFWQNLMQVALLVCFKTLPYLQINNVDFHESRECDSQSLVPSFPCTSPPNFNVRKTVHVESQEESRGINNTVVGKTAHTELSTILYQWGRMKHVKINNIVQRRE